MIDYEIVKDQWGTYQVWTPDATGGILGLGPTVEAAMEDAVKSCEDFVAEVQKGNWKDKVP